LKSDERLKMTEMARQAADGVTGSSKGFS